MTKQELLEGLAKAIQENATIVISENLGYPFKITDNGDGTGEILFDASQPKRVISTITKGLDDALAVLAAQAVIDYLSPMMGEAVEALERCYEVADYPANGKSKQDKALASLSAWREGEKL